MGAGPSREEETTPPTAGPIPKNAAELHENGNAKRTRPETMPPHNYEAILKDADSPVDEPSAEKLHEQLYAGVFLNRKRKKYWVTRASHENCFFLFARDLAITWADDKRFWHWPSFKEASDTFVDVAEMLNVCWLEVHGKFNTGNLTPGVKYEVAFVLMLRDPAYGWEVPVSVSIILPDGSKQERKEDMMEKPRGRWIEIPAGEFTAPPNGEGGSVEFLLYEYHGGAWKRGLVIKGVAVRPKSSTARNN